MDTLILYSLSVYFLFHVISRADITSAPRTWVLARLPKPLSYALTCPFCFAWWLGVGLTLCLALFQGVIMVSVLHLCATPVLCYLLDLIIQALVRVNTPPVVPTPSSLTFSNGGGLSVTLGDGEKIRTGMHPSYGGIALFGTTEATSSTTPSLSQPK